MTAPDIHEVTVGGRPHTTVNRERALKTLAWAHLCKAPARKAGWLRWVWQVTDDRDGAVRASGSALTEKAANKRGMAAYLTQRELKK